MTFNLFHLPRQPFTRRIFIVTETLSEFQDAIPDEFFPLPTTQLRYLRVRRKQKFHEVRRSA